MVIFLYKKQHQPNPHKPKPPNHQTTAKSIHPHINSPPPQESPQEFSRPMDPCSGAGGLKNLVQTKRRPVNSSPAVANGCKGRDAVDMLSGRKWLDMDQMVIGSVG